MEIHLFENDSSVCESEFILPAGSGDHSKAGKFLNNVLRRNDGSNLSC
jgi:hypothetical protein